MSNLKYEKRNGAVGNFGFFFECLYEKGGGEIERRFAGGGIVGL